MHDDATITAISAAAYRTPIDGPQSDGALEWDATTNFVVAAQAGGRNGTGWTSVPPRPSA
ncbi:hypothetical protein BTO20_26260 [Mycobacterium dioxanotrophicus]|uniref:Uncharacterized protein n=1 Tax=Mycobacterium dioxanotrophicus TaxID=482462 RepID=A0A1Y0C9C4_9MYCO|nr:hypothetical protein BTO20_26260 [Mycobacterium dioxanotrophicus]